jgi:DUF4097 and DUF4098 domain-containing protein YvlB
MSSYPPPPPGQYPPVYDRNAMRAQRQMLRAQVRIQQAQQRAARHQLRAQRRSLRRGSIVGPLIVVALGVIFLLAQTGNVSWGQLLEWYGRWWPAVLIAAGVILLLEWMIDQHRANSAGHIRVVGGGVIFLLILLALAGISSRGVEYGLNWRDQTFGKGFTKWDQLYGDRRDEDSSVNWAMTAGSSLLIRDPHGDVTVSGSSDDGQVHVEVHTQTYAWKDSDAQHKSKDLQPVFSNNNGVLTLSVSSVEGGQADLTISMPKSAPVTIQADRGDVAVNEMSSPVTISANNGDVDATALNNNVTLHVNDNDATVNLHSIHGAVSVEGHSGDIEVSDVTGDVALQGDFFGSTDLEHINGAVHFTTLRTQFSAARLDDEFSVDNDSLNATALLGPVLLKTADKNITLDRVQGSVAITNRNGSVELTNAAPLEGISIHNEHGSVDVGLPAGSGFALDAETRNGDMENDFGLTLEGSNEHHSLRGRVAGGGPALAITTTDGDVTVRRSSVAPLPATPTPPAITMTPPKPLSPKSSERPHRPAEPPIPPAAPTAQAPTAAVTD